MHPGLFFQGAARKLTQSRAPKTGKIIAFPSARPDSPPAHDTSDFFNSLLGRAGLSAASYRGNALARRLPACLRFLGVKTVVEAQRQLAARPDLHQGLINVVLLGVTEFYRDRSVFQDLRASVLPLLLEQSRPLRIWSAACSDGQELYSLAILFAEAGRLADCHLLGTDCRPQAIAQAQQASYKAEDLGGIDLSWRKIYFSHVDDNALANDRLRRAATWKIANLLTQMEPGPWHVISWRNMAIYLESSVAEETWQRLFVELAPGGFFLTGKADHPPAHLGLELLAPCVYRKPKSRP
jgi:chemotaxis methyl-accepting protein methylase